MNYYDRDNNMYVNFSVYPYYVRCLSRKERNNFKLFFLK